MVIRGRRRTMIMAIVAAMVVSVAAAPDAPRARLLWEASYDGGPGHHDYARQVVTTHRAIYVAATTHEQDSQGDFTLLRYSLRGDLRWERHVRGEALSGEPSDLVAVDGGVLITGLVRGSAGSDVTTVRFGPRGRVEWIRRQAVDDPVAFDGPPRLAVASDGSIRVSASSGGDFFVISYAPDGAKQWTRQVDASEGQDDVATDVAVDDEGNTYVAGPVGDHFGGYTTVRLDPTGHVDWAENVQGPIGNTLGPAFVEVGPDQLPVVSAVPETTCGLFQSRTWKFGADGGSMWEVSYPPDPCDSLITVGMRVRPDGSVVVLGTRGNTEFDLETLSYDASGQLEWARVHGGDGADFAGALAVDDAGRTYVTGEDGLVWPENTALTASYARDGKLRWSARADLDGKGERPVGIALLDDGSVAVTGGDFHPDRLEDVFTLRYRQP